MMVDTTVTTLTVSLVVEHDVRPPDLVGRHADELDPIELRRHPSQLVVVPNLREKTRRAFGEVNHLFLRFALYSADGP